MKIITIEEVDVNGQRFIANHAEGGQVVITREFLDAIEQLPGVTLIAIRPKE